VDAIIYLCFTILGLSAGSFFNLCIDRLPQGGSILSPPSHCENCGTRLKPADLVPVFSYLLLRGRCRHCGVKLPLRILIVEVVTASIFPLLAWNHGLSAELAFSIVYAGIFILIFFIDLEHGVILYETIIPGIVLAFAFSFFQHGFEEFWPQTGPGIALSALLGAAVGATLMLLPYLISRRVYGHEGMGSGDVYLAAIIGMATGFPLVLVALMAGIIAGGVFAASLLLLRRVGRKTAMPFGPFLAAGAMVALVWGDPIADWWLSTGF